MLEIDTMEKEKLMAQLRELGIDFPLTATLCQLRNLLKGVIGANAPLPQASNMTALAEEDAEVQPSESSTQDATAAVVQPSEHSTQTQDAAAAVVQPSEHSTQTHDEVAAVVQPSERSTQTQTKQDGAAVLPARKSSSQACAEQEAENDLTSIAKQMQAKLNILKLQQQIDELERQRNVKPKTVACFADVEGSLPKFTGDGEYNIYKWVKEFEKVTNIVGCTPAEQFLYARRMMAGSACLFMRTSMANNWPQFKMELCAEFKKDIGVKDILRKLENRKWYKGKETLHHYALVMQEIAEEAPIINQSELVEYIVEGLQDKTLASTVFFNTTTMADFKSKIGKYEKLLEERTQRYAKGGATSSTLENVRCFNCQAYGHYATSCPKERKQQGGCFKCGKMGHLRIHCPLKVVAAMPEEELNWNTKPN
ncbi:uncharacterized protein [Musca autumnalis]|uniref:uncharacterized protein n=1 Tax=Musca autumnalis TaxID=221902 RepID=UPI003CF0267F